MKLFYLGRGLASTPDPFPVTVCKIWQQINLTLTVNLAKNELVQYYNSMSQEHNNINYTTGTNHDINTATYHNLSVTLSIT